MLKNKEIKEDRSYLFFTNKTKQNKTRLCACFHNYTKRITLYTI